MEEDLHKWWPENKPSDEMLWKEAFANQLDFVASRLKYVMVPRGPEGYGDESMAHHEKVQKIVTVISTHVSKSIRLPVYKITWDWYGVTTILRNNFHDWKVSVESEVPVKINPHLLFDPKKQVHHVYCEGFDTSWVYKPYANDKSKFTAAIYDNYSLFTLFHLIRTYLDERKDK